MQKTFCWTKKQVSFQFGVPNAAGVNSYVEPGDGRRIYIDKSGRPVQVMTVNVSNRVPPSVNLPTGPVSPVISPTDNSMVARFPFQVYSMRKQKSFSVLGLFCNNSKRSQENFFFWRKSNFSEGLLNFQSNVYMLGKNILFISEQLKDVPRGETPPLQYTNKEEWTAVWKKLFCTLFCWAQRPVRFGIGLQEWNDCLNLFIEIVFAIFMSIKGFPGCFSWVLFQSS